MSQVLNRKTTVVIKATVLLVSLFFVLSCSSTEEKFELTNGLYISDVTILTSENGVYNPYKGYVVVEEEKIIYAGGEEPAVRGTFTKIDGNGKYLIPGLIDSHVHITEVQGMIFSHLDKYPELADEFRKQVPRSYLYFGFTTLINLGGISEEQIEFFNEQPLKPDLYHTGRSGISVANGYPMNFAPEQFRFDMTPNFIFLESEADRIPEKFDPADHTPEAAVMRVKKSGAIAVKSYYEPGFRGMPKLPVPTKEILESIQENTHSNGLVLTVHGNSLEAHTILSETGVDIIAHGLWLWHQYSDVPEDSLPAEIQNVLDLQIEKQIAYTPTLTVIAGEEVLVDREFLDDPQLKKVVPAAMIDWYKTEEGQWFAKEIFGALPETKVHEIYGNIQAHGKRALKYLSDHGGLILFGTDTPSGPTYGNQPGHNGYWEIKLMEEAGVPLNKILASATINNANAFRLDSILGSIATGKRANMILLSEDPLKRVEAYDAIEKVILGGQVIDRKELLVDRL